MPQYTFSCAECDITEVHVMSIRVYQQWDRPECLHGLMARDYRKDSPQPAAVMQEHYNPTTGSNVSSMKGMQDQMNRAADATFERTGIPSKPVALHPADLQYFK